MKDQLQDLEKLAELKERGVLSEAEFEAQKRALLDASKPKRRRPWWRIWAEAIALVVVIAVIVEALQEGNQKSSLACDNSIITDKVIESLNGEEDRRVQNLSSGLFSAGKHMNVHDIASTREIYRNPENGMVACIAYGADKRSITGYTVEWTDPDKGEFQLSTMISADLIAKYGSSRSGAEEPIEQAASASAHEAATVVVDATPQPVPASIAATPEECVAQRMKAYDIQQAADDEKRAKWLENNPGANGAGAGMEEQMREDAEADAKKACHVTSANADQGTPQNPTGSAT